MFGHVYEAYTVWCCRIWSAYVSYLLILWSKVRSVSWFHGLFCICCRPVIFYLWIYLFMSGIRIGFLWYEYRFRVKIEIWWYWQCVYFVGTIFLRLLCHFFKCDPDLILYRLIEMSMRPDFNVHVRNKIIFIHGLLIF